MLTHKLYSVNKETLHAAVSNSMSVAGALRLLGLDPFTRNYAIFKSKIDEYGLDTSHFTGQAVVTSENHPNKKTLDFYFDCEDPNINTHRFKLRLIQEGLLEHRCYKCGLTEWNDRPMPIELEHKDGNRKNNKLENLEILCPNCHAQTETYCAKNKRK